MFCRFKGLLSAGRKIVVAIRTRHLVYTYTYRGDEFCFGHISKRDIDIFQAPRRKNNFLWLRAPPRGVIILPHGRSSVQGAPECRTEIRVIRRLTTIAAFHDLEELGGIMFGFAVSERMRVGNKSVNFALRLYARRECGLAQ